MEGGAIKWDYFEPNITNTIFADNTGFIYGKDIASVPKYLIQVPSNAIGLSSFNPPNSMMIMSGPMKNVQSGAPISLYFSIVDKYF